MDRTEPLNALEGWSRWGKLRELGNSSLVKTSILMPVFGYMLLLNDQVHLYLTIKYDAWLLAYLNLPNIWRVWFLFYGSFAVSIATILYTVLCPEEIKRYASPFEMADVEGEIRVKRGQQKEVRSDIQAVLDGASSWEQSLFPKDRPALNRDTSGLMDQVGAIQTFLVFQWIILNRKRPQWRVAIFVLYAVGLILLALPAAVTLAQVSLLPFRSLL